MFFVACVGRCPADDASVGTPVWGGAPGRFSLVWLWCGGYGSVPRVCTERSGRPWVTLNLCVMRMRRYHYLGEGDLVSIFLWVFCLVDFGVVWLVLIGSLDCGLLDGWIGHV